MSAEDTPTGLPVLLLHNLDPTWAPSDIDEVLQEVNRLEAALRSQGHPITSVAVQDANLADRLRSYHPHDYVVLNWCEELAGLPRSDALVAEILEQHHFTYTGSTPEVLALSWDKPRAKQLLADRGVPTPRWQVFHTPAADGWDCFPAIVKPAREHCSLGVTAEAVVLNRRELEDRVAHVLEAFGQPALVEDFIDGREFHVSLWGDGCPRMLPPAEMDFTAFSDVRDRLCTYDSKFRPGSRHYDQIQLRLPAPLDEAEHDLLERVALAAYRAVGCRDYGRLDIRMRDGVFYVLDVNPNPDICADTSTACAAEAAGYSYGAMLSRLVGFAARRHPVFGARRH